jgi:hypothetical protein
MRIKKVAPVRKKPLPSLHKAMGFVPKPPRKPGDNHRAD